jgi:hypothetical protein
MIPPGEWCAASSMAKKWIAEKFARVGGLLTLDSPRFGLRRELFQRFFGRSCRMPHGALPADAGATHRLVIFPLEFEGEVPPAQPGEIQKYCSHEIASL